MAGQAISTLKWRILLAPVDLSTPYLRLLGFYFTGMFFNLFLPTIVGGDAVKALLLARETGAPARATMSVFMERNTGLCALLLIALVAAYLAPPVASLRHLAGDTDLAARCRLRRGQHRALLAAGLPDRGSIDRAVAAEVSARACGVAVRGGHPVHARDGRTDFVDSFVDRLPVRRHRRGILDRARLVIVDTSHRRCRLRAARFTGRHGAGERKRSRRARSPLHPALRPHRHSGGARGVAGSAVFRCHRHREPSRRARLRAAEFAGSLAAEAAPDLH
jgi:hypothetical protein